MSFVPKISRDLVADEIDDRLEIELGGEPFLHAVDDRELRRALVTLLEQPLRFVEEARVLQRDAHARGDRAEEPHLGIAVGVFAFVVLHDDHAEHAIAAEDRHADKRVALLGARHQHHSQRRLLRPVVRDHRLPRLQHSDEHPARRWAAPRADLSRTPCSYSYR